MTGNTPRENYFSTAKGWNRGYGFVELSWDRTGIHLEITTVPQRVGIADTGSSNCLGTNRSRGYLCKITRNGPGQCKTDIPVRDKWYKYFIASMAQQQAISRSLTMIQIQPLSQPQEITRNLTQTNGSRPISHGKSNTLTLWLSFGRCFHRLLARCVSCPKGGNNCDNSYLTTQSRRESWSTHFRARIFELCSTNLSRLSLSSRRTIYGQDDVAPSYSTALGAGHCLARPLLWHLCTTARSFRLCGAGPGSWEYNDCLVLRHLLWTGPSSLSAL